MICERCGGWTYVVTTRKGSEGVIRRRKCKTCGHIFCTEEVVIDRYEGETRMHINHMEEKHERQDKSYGS